MSKVYAVVFIAVGTELSQGQVINSNSAWLANHLSEAGLNTILHITVPDDRYLIQQSLESAALQTDLIIVSGGLGPTSDDFTRDIIADWLGQSLILNEASWLRLQERAQQYGFTLGQSQQKQCFFPEHAEVLINPVGTADAFYLESGPLKLVALPGPPREIKEIWRSGLMTKLSPLFPERPPTRLYLWQCMGIGEGTLAEKVDELVDATETQCQVGYRAYFPYIEVKLWLPESESSGKLIDKLETLLSPWAVLRQKEDAAIRLLHSLPPDIHIKIYDFGSHGALTRRISEAMPHVTGAYQCLTISTQWQAAGTETPDLMTELAKVREKEQQSSEAVATEAVTNNEIVLMIGAIEADHHWGLGLMYQEELKYERFLMPRRFNQQQIQIYQAEMALLNWWNWRNEKSIEPL